jgi:TIGR03009 family protein
MHLFLRTLIVAASWLVMFVPGVRTQPLISPQGSAPRGASGGVQQVQQVGALQPPAAQPIAPQQLNQPAVVAQLAAAPPGFQLNQLQQANLDVVLNAWQAESNKINTFRCAFERLEYDPAFGPAPNVPLFWNTGEMSFQKPDKGSFQIKEVKKWQQGAAAAGQQAAPAAGNWVADPKAVGEHWVCDGENIYEYRHDQKQLVVRPIPPQMQGQAIVDGPLPFLFGADAPKLKQRYWMVVNGANVKLQQNQIMISAVPKWASDAANYKSVDVILMQPAMLPSSMQIVLPNNGRYVYKFELEKATINDPFAQIKSWFKVPEILPGWQKVVEPMPVDQAMQPNAMPAR